MVKEGNYYLGLITFTLLQIVLEGTKYLHLPKLFSNYVVVFHSLNYHPTSKCKIKI